MHGDPGNHFNPLQDGGGIMEPITEERVKTMTPDELIEEGLGLVARGMFRLGDRGHMNKPMEAYDKGMSVVSVVRDMAVNFYRIGNKPKN